MVTRYIGEIKVTGISYNLIKHFGLPLPYAYATLRQSVAGNSPFRGIVFCNLRIFKTVISNFVTKNMLPHILPHVNMTTPTMFPVDKKASSTNKSQGQNCINSFLAHKLSHDHRLRYFLGVAYGSLHDAEFDGACGLGVWAF
jgi:hypothetical protein